jgi:Fic-DOC domain mobile mystery protein B
MGLELIYQDGQTPLDEEEKEGLLIEMITTRGELDEQEQLNIETAVEWTLRKKFSADDIFTEEFVNNLHERMYGNVWRWAGEFRKSNKNIGVDKLQIPVELRYLLDDGKYWLAHNTYSPDELAIRFKHRIVNIHCYPNGNGRHSRLIADVIVSHILGGKVFTWGRADLVKEGEARSVYLNAIRAADTGEFTPLIQFARS